MPPPRDPAVGDRIDMAFVVPDGARGVERNERIEVFAGRVTTVYRTRHAEGRVVSVAWDDGTRDRRRVLMDDSYDAMDRESGWRFVEQAQGAPRAKGRVVKFDAVTIHKGDVVMRCDVSMRETQSFRKLANVVTTHMRAAVTDIDWTVDGRRIEDLDAPVSALGITDGCIVSGTVRDA